MHKLIFLTRRIPNLIWITIEHNLFKCMFSTQPPYFETNTDWQIYSCLLGKHFQALIKITIGESGSETEMMYATLTSPLLYAGTLVWFYRNGFI